MPAGKGKVSEVGEALRLPTADPVVVFAKWCKGCGICVEFCPTKALAMGKEDRPYLLDADRCSSCGMCEIRCPDFAINVTHRKRG
ncbi:MAG: 4Fe-4S binding protein [Chloroflexi bacterium]|nr:4Fe-4S binding protein [Chloroflexota bacterium]MCL5107475.1 4Fe-4S binding protein [Chloroflexota bacterium]MDA8219775.1 4Fe-4S binding protein [Dehalococcoidales bacterium]